MNTPREWEAQFDEEFQIQDDCWGKKKYGDYFTIYAPSKVKRFIRIIEDKAREEEREKANISDFSAGFTFGRSVEREMVRELVEGQKYDEDEEDLGAEAIADHAYKDKFEAFRYGYNQALSDIITALNEKEV